MPLKTYHVHRTQRVSTDPHWTVNCTAYCAAMMIVDATTGGVTISGRQVRAESSEPTPDPASPGLNIPQIRTVAAKYRVKIDDMQGHSWQEAVAAMDHGRRILLSIDYRSLGSYRCQANGDFGHAVVMVKVKAGDRTRIICSDPLCSSVKEYPSQLLHDAATKFARDTGVREGLRWAQTRIIPRVEA